MNHNHLSYTILLILGIMGLVKSIFGLAQPSLMKRLCIWWSKAVPQVNTLIGCVCFLMAIALWAVVLIDQPLTNWLLVLFGVLCAWIGTVYFRPHDFQKLLNVLILDRKPIMIRVVFLATAILSIFFIWVAVKGI